VKPTLITSNDGIQVGLAMFRYQMLKIPTHLYSHQRAEAVLRTMSKNGFQHVFQDWQTHWAKCIQLNGDYFEKDHIKLDSA
jgi:hypothetical protein